MSAVEVPAELIELCVDTIEALAKMVPALDLAWQQEVARMGRQLRALLPKLTCPKCGHSDEEHATSIGCAYDNGDEFDDVCSCPFSAETLPHVRALLDAERDSKPAQAGPRVWHAGDPEPGDVEQVRDCETDVWSRIGNGWDIPGRADIRSWSSLVAFFGPLTEVLPAVTS